MATTRVAVAPMKLVQVPKPGGDFEIVEREIPKLGPGHVLISGVRPMIETYALEKAAEAYARMISGNAQFRVVLTM